MPSVDVVHLAPGLFAFPYFLGLPAVAHFGQLMAPFGDGKNAPPSNEDIANVAAHTLMAPEQHIGKSYRPTGPKLLSPQDVAGVFAKILDRDVKYKDVPSRPSTKPPFHLGFPQSKLCTSGIMPKKCAMVFTLNLRQPITWNASQENRQRRSKQLLGAILPIQNLFSPDLRSGQKPLPSPCCFV